MQHFFMIIQNNTFLWRNTLSGILLSAHSIVLSRKKIDVLVHLRRRGVLYKVYNIIIFPLLGFLLHQRVSMVQYRKSQQQHENLTD